MRIQLNQYWSDVPYEYHKYNEDNYFDINYIAKICKHCHSEIYGKWLNPVQRYSDYIFDYKGSKAYVSGYLLHKPLSEFHANFVTKDDSTLGGDLIDLSLEEKQKIQSDLLKIESDWKNEEKIEEEKEEICQLNKCPICGEPLPEIYTSNELVAPGYKSVAKRYNIDVDQLSLFLEAKGITNKAFYDIEIGFDFLRWHMRRESEALSAKQVQELITLLDVPAPLQQASSQVSEIKSSAEKLKEYIHTLFSLETNIYSIQKRLQTLYADQMDAACDLIGIELGGKKQIKEEAEQRQKEYQIQIAEFEKLKNSRPKVICLNKPDEPMKPKEPYYEKPNFFNIKRVVVQNENRKAEYEKECRDYEVAIEKYKREVEQIRKQEEVLIAEEQERHAKEVLEAKNKEPIVKAALESLASETEKKLSSFSQLPSPVRTRKSIVDEEIAKTEDLLKRTLDCRNQLYAYDIVFGKYRNLVALATFYEYLISGRCTSLEGANGAYNIFEAECRANQIIGQLSKIIDSLDAIKESQYLVYTQLKRINSSLYSLNSSMDKMNKTLKSIDANTRDTNQYLERISKNSDVIAYNTAATAYYSQLNASLTNSLGYLIALH